MCTLCEQDALIYEPSEVDIGKVLLGACQPPLSGECKDIGVSDEDMALFKRTDFTDEEKPHYARAVLLAHIRIARHIYDFTGPASEAEAFVIKCCEEVDAHLQRIEREVEIEMLTETTDARQKRVEHVESLMQEAREARQRQADITFFDIMKRAQ